MEGEATVSLHLLSNFSEMVSLGLLLSAAHLDKLTKQGLA
jgi:hypothetical protein